MLAVKSSYMELLTEVYPEYDWLPWKFLVCPKSYWENPKSQKLFVDWAAKELNLLTNNDWYNVTIHVNIIISLLPY